MQWLAADDDNGNLSDGTPHMTALFNAFNRHGIACATPAPVNAGCAGGPGVAPVLTATPESSSRRSPGARCRALPSSGTLTLSFAWYLAHGSNASSADFFRLKLVAGTTTTLFSVPGAAVNRNGVWGKATLSLNAFAGQTIRLLFEATDSGPDSLIEAAVDDVRIVQE